MTSASAPGATTTELRAQLAAFLTDATGEPAEVGDLTLLSGGNAREMWAFDATIGAERRSLVLRKDPPGGGPHAISFQLDRATEFRAMRAAHEVGVPVAEVLWLIEDRSVFGEAGFIMERLEGETIPRRILREPQYEPGRRVAARQLGEILARLHQIDPVPLGLRPPNPDRHPAWVQIEEYTGYIDELADPRPIWEIGMRWLKDNVPATWRTTAVHGDFRNGNLMLDERGVVAVLDWETMHIGDPMEDLGWLCVRSWRYGNTDRPVGGFGSREELLDGYESVAGFRPDPAVLHYWEVFGTLKWGVLSSANDTKTQERSGIEGGVMASPGRAIERLAQSRRACEMEYDLLRLLEGS